MCYPSYSLVEFVIVKCHQDERWNRDVIAFWNSFDRSCLKFRKWDLVIRRNNRNLGTEHLQVPKEEPVVLPLLERTFCYCLRDRVPIRKAHVIDIGDDDWISPVTVNCINGVYGTGGLLPCKIHSVAFLCFRSSDLVNV